MKANLALFLTKKKANFAVYKTTLPNISTPLEWSSECKCKPTESADSSAVLRMLKNFLRNSILEIAYNKNGALDQVIIIEQKTEQKGALNWMTLRFTLCFREDILRAQLMRAGEFSVIKYWSICVEFMDALKQI